MKKINRTSGELSKIEMYLLTQSTSMIMIKDISDGTEIKVDKWCFFDDIDEEKDKSVSLLSIFDGSTTYCTQSITFFNAFMEMAELFDGEPFTVIKDSGETKAGRTYVSCHLKI